MSFEPLTQDMHAWQNLLLNGFGDEAQPCRGSYLLLPSRFSFPGEIRDVFCKAAYCRFLLSFNWAPWRHANLAVSALYLIGHTEDIGHYDYRPVTLLFACFISFQRYALS